jgi:hypothetical protein
MKLFSPLKEAFQCEEPNSLKTKSALVPEVDTKISLIKSSNQKNNTEPVKMCIKANKNKCEKSDI